MGAKWKGQGNVSPVKATACCQQLGFDSLEKLLERNPEIALVCGKVLDRTPGAQGIGLSGHFFSLRRPFRLPEKIRIVF